MKFIMSNSDDVRIDIENDFELAVEKLREVDKLHAREEVAQMLDKMKAISDNLIALKDQAFKEAEATKATLDGKPLNDRYIKESKEIPNTEYILVDIDMAYDEFHLMYDEDNFLPNSCCHIEVETEYAAREADISFGLGLTDEERKYYEYYKVGEILSLYRRLGDSEYYYRFL